MRKLISASKRKWVLGGILGFAAIALTTTGFATWIVGINATTSDGTVGVTVDTTLNNGVELKLELGSDTDIELKEANSSTGPVVTVTDNDSVSNPLQISVKTFTLEVGKQFLNSNTITGVEFKLKYATDNSTTDIKNNADNKVTDNKIGNKRTTNELGYWEYISAPAKIGFTNEDITNSEDLTTYTYQINASTLDFERGNFFENKSPAAFYNEKFATGATKEDVDNIFAELEAMNTALDKDTLVLTASLAYTAK